MVAPALFRRAGSGFAHSHFGSVDQRRPRHDYALCPVTKYHLGWFSRNFGRRHNTADACYSRNHSAYRHFLARWICPISHAMGAVIDGR